MAFTVDRFNLSDFPSTKGIILGIVMESHWEARLTIERNTGMHTSSASTEPSTDALRVKVCTILIRKCVCGVK